MAHPELDRRLGTMLRSHAGVSDVLFAVGRPAQVEAFGVLKPGVPSGSGKPLTPKQTETVARAVVGTNELLRQTLVETGSCDCAYAMADGTRFRANVFLASGCYSVVMRVLPREVPTLKGLGVPQALHRIPTLNNGLVLVTGATGSGKSTTLAAVVDGINATRPVHVVTLEDPIEYVHPHKRGTVNQRELGLDFQSYAGGLRAALRQAPKVILVGEMRDRETVEIALMAADTGHLVLSTLHTVDAGQTVQRILGLFDRSEEELVRARLAQVLRLVVAQRLIPRRDQGRVAVFEVMGTSLRIREMIQKGETGDATFYNVISEGTPYGWQTFDQHILELTKRGMISEETAKAYGSDASVVRQGIDQLRAARGEDTSGLGKLEMAYARRIVR